VCHAPDPPAWATPGEVPREHRGAFCACFIVAMRVTLLRMRAFSRRRCTCRTASECSSSDRPLQRRDERGGLRLAVALRQRGYHSASWAAMTSGCLLHSPIRRASARFSRSRRPSKNERMVTIRHRRLAPPTRGAAVLVPGLIDRPHRGVHPGDDGIAASFSRPRSFCSAPCPSRRARRSPAWTAPWTARTGGLPPPPDCGERGGSVLRRRHSSSVVTLEPPPDCRRSSRSPGRPEVRDVVPDHRSAATRSVMPTLTESAYAARRTRRGREPRC